MHLFTLDFETYYDKEYSLSKLTTERYIRSELFEVIGVSVKRNDEPPQWFSGSKLDTAAWLQQFDIPNGMVCAHNTAFDGLILSHHFNIIPKFYFDTMSMARPLHAMTCGVSLKALSDKYTVGLKGDEVVLALGKHRSDFTPQEMLNYSRYCMNDTQLCYMLWRIFSKDLPRSEIKVIDQMIRMFTDPVLELDPDVLEEHLKDVVAKKEAMIVQLGTLTDRGVLMSNQKFAALLESFGVSPPMKISNTTHKETFAFAKTDAPFRELLEHEDLRVQTVVAGRMGLKSSIEETRTKAFIGIAGRGPLPIMLNYYGAHTGRASGGDKINLQNLPRGGALRRAIKAPPGHTLVVSDSSQIEARITAWLAGQEDLVEDFANKVDLYSKFASDVYGRPVDRKRKEIVDGVEVTPDEVEGRLGKLCILGLGFGMGPPKLQVQLKGAGIDLPLRKVEDIVYNVYRGKYSRIPKLWEQGDAALAAIYAGQEYTFGRNGLLTTNAEGIALPNGMMVRYPSLTYGVDKNNRYPSYAYVKDRRQSAEWVKQQLSGEWDFNKLTRVYSCKVIENVVQALARIVVFDQMVEIGRYYKCALTVHDELVLCVPLQEAERAKDLLTQTMKKVSAWAMGLPIACEAHIGETYGAAK